MKATLLHPTQRFELRQHDARRAKLAHQLQTAQSLCRGDDPLQLKEYTLGRDLLQSRRLRARGRDRLGLGLQLQLDRDPHQAQDS